MSFLDDVVEQETGELDVARQQGEFEMHNDPHVKHTLAEKAHENFASGHNSGYACGIMAAVLQHCCAAAASSDTTPERQSRLFDLLSRIETFSAASKAMRINEQMLGVQMVEIDNVENEMKHGEVGSLPTVVAFADEFSTMVGSSLASFAPPEAVTFLRDMVDYNKAALRVQMEEPLHAALAVVMSERQQQQNQQSRSEPSQEQQQQQQQQQSKPTGAGAKARSKSRNVGAAAVAAAAAAGDGGGGGGGGHWSDW